MEKKKILFLGIAVGYLGALMPGRKREGKTRPVKYYAHRGLYNNSGSAPENTMAAFNRAVKAGYGIELDVQLTKDGKVVVTHDFHLRRNCGVEGDVDQFTYQELQQFPVFHSEERIPLLEDVLKRIDGKVPLLVELKYKEGSRICEKTSQLLDEYKGAYVIESFHPQVLLWYKKHSPQVVRGQLSMNYQKIQGWFKPQYLLMRGLLLNFLTRPDFIAYDCRNGYSLSLQICRHLYGCPVYGWTVKSKSQLRKVKKYFDGFIFEDFRPEPDSGH